MKSDKGSHTSGLVLVVQQCFEQNANGQYVNMLAVTMLTCRCLAGLTFTMFTISL